MSKGHDSAPAGWYADPAGGSSVERYWDGERWTENARLSGPQKVEASETDVLAEIEVSRQFNLWMGIALAWDVFVDGAWMDTCKNGKKVRFQIQPGSHTFKMWTQRRKACSNELQLDVQPGTVRYLHCRMNKTQFYAGLFGSYRQRWEYQKQLRGEIRDAGGVNQQGILLYEDERLIRPDWATNS